MNIDHTQNEDDLDPKSPFHHIATETFIPCRDQSNEDIGNVIVISIPMKETLCHNHVSDKKYDNAKEETAKSASEFRSVLSNG